MKKCQKCKKSFISSSYYKEHIKKCDVQLPASDEDKKQGDDNKSAADLDQNGNGKVSVSELAESLQLENKDIMKFCKDLGYGDKRYNSPLTEEQIAGIKEYVAKQ